MGLSFLVGSLLIATGPTVITPIGEVVPVHDRVAAALEIEGTVNDVTAAILAVAVFEAALGGETALGALVESFVSRLGRNMRTQWGSGWRDRTPSSDNSGTRS